MTFKPTITGGFLLLCGLVLQSKAQDIPLDPAVKAGKLPNGFSYYIRHNEAPKQRVQLYLVNNIGSILEDDDQQGLAHFMEHMNFNGTRNFPKNQLIDYLQKAGVRFGADLNAHTGTDETVYQLPLPTEDPALLLNGIKIMRDWAQEAILDPAEIEKERGVVIEEGRLAKGAKDRMARQYYPMMLNHSRYSKRLTIGLEEVLLHFNQATIKRFHQDWYRPDLQALIVVGDINVSEIEKLIKAHFSDLKTPANKRPRENHTVPLSGQNQFMAVTDKEMSGVTLEVLFKRKAKELKTEADYLQMMKRSLLSKLMASRRYAEISRLNNAAYTNMSMDLQPLIGGTEMFFFEVTAKEGQLQQAFAQSWSFLEKVKRFGFTQAELDQVKQNYLRTFQTSLTEKDKTPSVSFVTEYQNLYLHKQAAPGIEWEAAFVKQHLNNITLADISALTKDYLQDINRDILILAPEKDKATLPDAPTVESWMALAGKANLSPFKEEQVATELMPSKPKPGKVTSKTEIPEIGATVLTLSNGIKVILKPTDFKNDQVLFRGFSPGGTSLYQDEEYDNVANAAALISRFGLGNYNPSQLNQVLNGKVMNVSASINPRNEMINGSSSMADLESALQVAHLQFTQPRKDSLLFRNILNSSKEGIRGRYADPANVFADTINYVMSNYSYRFSAPSPEKLDKISLDKVYAIYKDRFADASGFTFIFAGSFKPENIIPLINQYLGSLPSLNRKEKPRDLNIHIPEGQLVKKVYKGSENKATVRLVFSGNYDYSPENNQLLNALGDILQIKVLQRLRETEGEVYSPSVQSSFTKLPKNRYGIIVSFGCAPQNADHLIEAVSQEMESIRKSGVLPEDIHKYKAAYSKNVELALKDNGYWLNYLSGQYENGENVLEVLDADQTLNKVTPENLKRAASLFLKADNRIQFILLPEKQS